MRLLQYVLSIIIFLTISLPISVQAESTVLRVALTDLPPWKMVDAKGVAQGIDVELLELLAERLGLELEYSLVPFRRGLYLLESGEADIQIGVLRRPEREAYMYFIEPPYKNHTDKAFFVLKGNEHMVQKHEDLHSLRVGTRIGVSYFPKFDNDPAIIKESVKALDLNFKMLMAGRVDTVVYTETTGDYTLRKLGLDQAITKAPYGYRKQQDVYMVLSKKSPFASRLDEFNRVMADLVRGGEHGRIKKRFLSSMKNPVVSKK